MPHRAHLFSLRLAHALRESCFQEPYKRETFARDLLAGLTVGVIAIPLAMALAIASGVPPEYGLYTAFVAGLIIALTGGSRLSISGPTAAFVVILYPITQQYGLAGLLLATVMSGAILILMAYFRLGRLIEYIPESVTTGFTAGIAVVIATLQINDFFGLKLGALPDHYTEKVTLLATHFNQTDSASLIVALVTLGSFIAWRKLGSRWPPHLFAVLMGVMCSMVLAHYGLNVDTIGTRFSYVDANGITQHGIPPYFPEWKLPWQFSGPNNSPLEFSWVLLKDLGAAAFAIAMLGAIESLLCAVVLDGLTGKRHSANSELLGQGLGNLIAPFFGGITATAAIARSSVNFRAGGQTPVAAVVHAIVVLLGLLFLAPVLNDIPMATMAAVLMMVAWNIAELEKVGHLIRHAPRTDMVVFLVCFSLTVLFDMVIAITTGVLLSAVLFMKEIADMTRVTDISRHPKLVPDGTPDGWRVYKIVGPLFFAAADRVYGELTQQIEDCKGVVLYLDAVTVLDAGGLSTTLKFIEHCEKRGTLVVFADWQFQPLRTLARAGVKPREGVCVFTPTLHEALHWMKSYQRNA